MTLEARKSNIIEKIKYVNEGWLIKSIEKLLSDVEPKGHVHGRENVVSESSSPDYSYYVGNIEEKVNIEKIKRERPLRKLDTEAFSKLADAIVWDKSIEELLKDLD